MRKMKRHTDWYPPEVVTSARMGRLDAVRSDHGSHWYTVTDYHNRYQSAKNPRVLILDRDIPRGDKSYGFSPVLPAFIIMV